MGEGGERGGGGGECLGIRIQQESPATIDLLPPASTHTSVMHTHIIYTRTHIYGCAYPPLPPSSTCSLHTHSPHTDTHTPSPHTHTHIHTHTHTHTHTLTTLTTHTHTLTTHTPSPHTHRLIMKHLMITTILMKTSC